MSVGAANSLTAFPDLGSLDLGSGEWTLFFDLWINIPQTGTTYFAGFGARADTSEPGMGANGNRLIHFAAEKRWEPALVEKLIELGADVNVQNLWKKTPLHLAADANHVAAIRILLHHGADVYAHDVNGVTPLDIVKKKNKKRTLAVFDAHLNR